MGHTIFLLEAKYAQVTLFFRVRDNRPTRCTHKYAVPHGCIYQNSRGMENMFNFFGSEYGLGERNIYRDAPKQLERERMYGPWQHEYRNERRLKRAREDK